MEASSDAVDAAIARMTELLRSPDDLVKVSLLRKRFAKEKATTDAQLKTGVKAQLDNTRQGLETLDTSRKEMVVIKENMQGIDKLCSSAQGMIQHFPRISKISQVHRNFVATQETINKLQEMYTKLDTIRGLLYSDRQDPTGPAKNLLLVHYQLFHMSEFKDSTMFQARNASQDVIITLQKYFQPLDDLVEVFENYLWTLTRNLIDLARLGRGTVIVRLVKIIEAEEQADERATTAEQARQSHQELATKFKSIQTSPRVIRSYRSKFLNKLHVSISDMFNSFFDGFKEDPPQLLDNTEFIYDDLKLVNVELMRKFPKKYNIFAVFVLEYHRHIYNMLDKLSKSDLDAVTMLRMIKFVRKYHKRMAKELRVPEDMLEPRLLDGREQELVDDYMKLVRSKLEEWSKNLMNDEISEFVERAKPPEKDADMLYVLQGAVIMFQMVNQQIDVAAESGQAKILADVVKQCSEVMTDTQRQWMKVIKSEVKKQMDQREETPPGFVEYVMALANDQIRCAEFTEDVVKRLEPMLAERYRAQINADLNVAMDGFLNVSKVGTDTILDIVFNDLKRPFSQMYTAEWYQSDPMLFIIETLKDYAQDFKTHLNAYLLHTLMSSSLDRFLIACIETMRQRGAKFRMGEFIEIMHKDIRLARDFFIQLIPKDELAIKFDALERLSDVLAASRATIFLEYYKLRQSFGDVPVGLIEDILSKRDDLERSNVKEIMETIKSKAKESGPYNGEPTIFSKMNS
ncbi:9493_t:CDS:2 [Paraglomus brasilianum]|uniref:9493_t:CDS:1 n=1 Tax=Paraglomus brasilianum TaxID=144538 RepID=A0A9N9FRX0_9GLOM|nr:9493_t:CDS:2 [Paraglomus brasilianum]